MPPTARPSPRPRAWATPSGIPTADVEGYDAGAKAAIIATIAFGVRVVAGDVYHEGISGITAADITFARRLGYVVKLLAIAEAGPGDDGVTEVAVRVHPAMVPAHHPLASVRDSFNAVFVEGDAVGELMFYGRGAGGGPTASAVLGDLIDAAVNLRRGSHATVGALARARIRPIDDVTSAYYLNLEVADRARRAAPRSPACSATTACRSARWSRRASAARPASSSSPTRPSSATCRPPCTTSASSTPSTGSARVLRVVGDGPS